MLENNTYDEDVKLFKKVLSTEASKLLSSDALTIVYMGRRTCPFCRKFAKKLNGLAHQINSSIYYVESDNPSDSGIDSFREKYNIVTVPGFIVSKNGKIDVRCDSSLPEKQLLDMLK